MATLFFILTQIETIHNAQVARHTQPLVYNAHPVLDALLVVGHLHEKEYNKWYEGG